MHLNPHAKCRSSRFDLKLLKKKNGGHLNSGNTLGHVETIQLILGVTDKFMNCADSYALCRLAGVFLTLSILARKGELGIVLRQSGCT